MAREVENDGLQRAQLQAERIGARKISVEANGTLRQPQRLGELGQLPLLVESWHGVFVSVRDRDERRGQQHEYCRGLGS